MQKGGVVKEQQFSNKTGSWFLLKRYRNNIYLSSSTDAKASTQVEDDNFILSIGFLEY